MKVARAAGTKPPIEALQQAYQVRKADEEEVAEEEVAADEEEDKRTDSSAEEEPSTSGSETDYT